MLPLVYGDAKLPGEQRRPILIILTYVVSLVATLPLLQKGVVGYPIEHRVTFALWQGCGIFTFVIPFDRALVAFLLCWTVWLALACTTRLRCLPSYGQISLMAP